jgi:hypothetical protein
VGLNPRVGGESQSTERLGPPAYSPAVDSREIPPKPYSALQLGSVGMVWREGKKAEAPASAPLTPMNPTANANPEHQQSERCVGPLARGYGYWTRRGPDGKLGHADWVGKWLNRMRFLARFKMRCERARLFYRR